MPRLLNAELVSFSSVALASLASNGSESVTVTGLATTDFLDILVQDESLGSGTGGDRRFFIGAANRLDTVAAGVTCPAATIGVRWYISTAGPLT